MTSSNVTNMLVQMGGINVEMPEKAQPQADNIPSFEKTLKNVSFAQDNSLKVSDLPKKNSGNDLKAAEAKLNTSKDATSVKTKEKPDAADGKIEEKVTDAADNVKQVIKDELDVTDEDIKKAMENLGFSAMDLLVPQNLAEVVAELSGETDSIALVMSDEFKTILDSMTEISNELIQEVGIAPDDFKEVVISFKEELPPEIPVEEAEFVNTYETTPIEEPEKMDSKPQILVEAEITVRPQEVKEPEAKPEKPEIRVELAEPKPIEKDEGSKGGSETESDFFNENQKDFRAARVNIREAGTPEAEGAIVFRQDTEVQFIPEESAVTLPTGERVTSDEIVNQLIEQARVLSDTESTTMEMVLNPEGLGKIYMEVTQKGNEITAKIFTENDAVRQALESQMANLRAGMNENSVKVTSVEVSVGTHEFEKNLEENAENQQRSEEQSERQKSRSSRIDLNSLEGLEDLSGVMSEEDLLIAQMMMDNGNSLDFQA